MDVTALYLDGNNIDSLKPSNLIARKSLKTLYLNASNLQYLANRTFNGLIELQTLYLNDNILRSLNGYEFEPLAQLRALYLQSNRLDHINNQTFIYLRSLEILDLSNNRLTSMNLDLFMSIGHHNIRLRQLTIAHNWWSCQCSLINNFRQILKQKFLVNGGVNIADRNQLRCYYNSTTVGPLILDGIASLGSSIQQPVYGSFLPSSGYQQQQLQQNNRQQQLTEINQCSDMIEEHPYDTDVNPPIIHPPIIADFPMQFQNVMPPNDSPDNNMSQQQQQQQQSRHHQANPNQIQVQSQNQIPNTYNAPPYDSAGPINMNPGLPFGIGNEYNLNGLPHNGGVSGPASVPLTSFVFVSVLFVCIFVVAVSVFIFVRQQQRYHNHHHKKSSAASTISVSSSASSTAISTAHHAQNNHGTSKFPYRDHQHHHQHHLSQPLNYGQHHTLHHNHQHQLIMGTNVHNTAQLAGQVMPQAHHHHTTSSQSNIYAALVSPTTGSSTIVTTNHANHQQQHQNNNLYSNSSTTASHHSSASSSQHINGHGGGINGPSYPNATTNRLQHQQAHYGAPIQAQQQQQQLYGLIDSESPYAINASIAPYKTGTSLHSGMPPSLPESNCQEGLVSPTDWIKLPKVKQFMSKLVNKSLALSGYRSSNSRDEISAATSDKIYDAFLSYDKRDEPFVMQHLSAELEYGQPQYR